MANEDIPSGVDALVILVEDPNAKREGFKVRSEPASSSSPLFCLLENRAINLGGKGHWNLKFWRDGQPPSCVSYIGSDQQAILEHLNRYLDATKRDASMAS